jgi:hypothetical protein
MGRARERGEVRDRAASERVARRRDPARREKRGREPRENARASSDEEDWSEEEARDRRRRDARGARRGASSSSRDARPREGAARARRRVVAASPSASDVSSDEASRRESASDRSDDDASSGESDAERDEPEQPRGLGRLWRVAGRGVIGGVLAARSALASTSVRREARSASRADANSDASSSDVFETESESEHESESESETEHEPLDTRVRHVAVKRLKTRASESETSSDSDWDVETARALRGDASERRRISAPRTNAQFTSRKKRKKQMDAARLQAALVRERLDAADERRTREKETSSKTRAEKTVTFATSAAPETAPLLSSAAFEQRATTKRLIKRATSVGTASGASLTKLVLLSAVALLGVVMLSAGASSVLAATLSENGPSESRSASSSTRPFFAAERRETRRDEAPSTSFSTSTVTADENTVVPARDAGVRALDVYTRGLDDARVADAEADAMVRAATAAAAEAKAKTSSEEVASEPEMASPEVASPEVASPAFVESASDDDDESERRPHVTDDMTYEEKQAEFARFAAAEAARNDRIAAEAAERERANAAGEQTAETEEVVNVVEAEGRPPETETEASETTVAEPAEEEPGPDETDSSSWPLVGAGQRLIVNVPDDVTQDATAEIETGAMTPDEEVRRSASVAGLGSDSR